MTALSRITRDMADAPDSVIDSGIPLVRALKPEYEVAYVHHVQQQMRRITTRDLEDELDYLRREQLEAKDSTPVAHGITEPDDWTAGTSYRMKVLRQEIDRRARWEQHTPLTHRARLVDFAHELKRSLDLPVFLVHKGYCSDMRKMGHQYVSRCPLHGDKTPSFYIWDESRFMCFGCGQRGDVFDLCEQLGMAHSWRDAVEVVANYLNVRMPQAGPKAIWEAYTS